MIAEGVPHKDPSESPREQMELFYNILKNAKNPEDSGVSGETFM